MPRLNITEEEQLKNLNGVPTPKKTKGEKMNRQEQILAEESKAFHEQKKKQMLNYKDEVELQLMKDLKNFLDPKNILNPGKIF